MEQLPKQNKTNKLNQHTYSAYISYKFLIMFTIVFTIQKWIPRDEDYEAAHSGIQHAIPSLLSVPGLIQATEAAHTLCERIGQNFLKDR